jgi:2-haloacid dehalogenase
MITVATIKNDKLNAPSALVFDVNETLLDMTSVKQGLASVLNDDETLVDLWFTTLLHHSLVDVASAQFHDFIEIGAAALVMVAHGKGITLSHATAKQTIKKHITSLPAHPDVKPALLALQQYNIPLIALSNSSIEGLKAQLAFAGISEYFTHVLSTETIRTYKPAPQVYHWACKEVGVEASRAMMVAAHGWDVSGAKAAGMRTAFIEREGKMPYPLGLPPDYVFSHIGGVASLFASA